MRSFARTSHGEVADHDYRNVEFLLFKDYAMVEHRITHRHYPAVNFADRVKYKER